MSRPTPWKPGTFVPVAVNPLPPVQPAQPAAPATNGCAVPRTQPTYARPAGRKWSHKERDLTLQTFATGGLAAVYILQAHRSRPAIRGFLQRAGVIPRKFKKPAFTP